MKFVIQRVTRACVSSEGEDLGRIGKGYVVLIGISGEDDTRTADAMIRKMCNLRIFADSDGKTNLSLQDVKGELLLISQFTLYADCRKGNRPSFIHAGDPQEAEKLYEYILSECKKTISVVRQGKFGADMQVELVNDGPFTVVLDSADICKGRKQ